MPLQGWAQAPLGVWASCLLTSFMAKGITGSHGVMAAAANLSDTGEQGDVNQQLPIVLIHLKLQILPLSLDFCPSLSHGNRLMLQVLVFYHYQATTETAKASSVAFFVIQELLLQEFPNSRKVKKPTKFLFPSHFCFSSFSKIKVLLPLTTSSILRVSNLWQGYKLSWFFLTRRAWKCYQEVQVSNHGMQSQLSQLHAMGDTCFKAGLGCMPNWR